MSHWRWSQESPPAWAHALGLAVAILATLLVYHNAVTTFFAQDDIIYLSRAGTSLSGGSALRALSTGLGFRLEYALFDLDPYGYHVVNIVCHVLSLAGVYVLAAIVLKSPPAACVAALLFGTSTVAFTPLHWASGITELLTALLLVVATLMHIASWSGRIIWRWLAAAVALAAMFSKETAAAWVLIVVGLELSRRNRLAMGRALVPSILATLAFALVLVHGKTGLGTDSAGAYAWTLAPRFLAQNLATYLRWSVAFWEPIHDLTATSQPRAWMVAVPLVAAWVVGLCAAGPRDRVVPLVGLWWWCVFLIPVLPLRHHTYLYYLYIPMVGGVVACVSIVWTLCVRGVARLPEAAITLAAVVLAGVEARNVSMRQDAVRDYLPSDRTLRDAVLLEHALSGLNGLRLPSGTRIGFVNPVPRVHFDVVGGRAAPVGLSEDRMSYRPLEAALGGGKAVRLFFPDLEYVGFADTIPDSWSDVECLYYEQRGWLRSWGRGQSALLKQGEVQLAANRWADAERTFVFVRALGDTVRAAVEGQALAVAGQGRLEEARNLMRLSNRRWPSPLTGVGH
jgi:hypothetical protein